MIGEKLGKKIKDISVTNDDDITNDNSVTNDNSIANDSSKGKKRDDLFCKFCSKPIEEGNFCESCDKAIKDGKVFCKHCGKVLKGSSLSCDACGKNVCDEETNHTQKLFSIFFLTIFLLFFLAKVFLFKPFCEKDENEEKPQSENSVKSDGKTSQIQSIDLGDLALDINGIPYNYSAQKAFEFKNEVKQWHIDFQSKKNIDNNKITLYLPEDICSNKTIVIDKKANDNLNIPLAKLIYTDNNGERFELGNIAGDGNGNGIHKSSNVTIIVDNWDTSVGTASGMISGRIAFAGGENVVFTKGIFKAQIHSRYS